MIFAVVVVVAGLVSVLGRGLVADSSLRGAGPFSAGVEGLLFADQSPNEVLPPSGKAGDDPRPRSDEVDQGGQPAEASQADGPSGARATTGTSGVALTFDDGPDPRYTPQVLALLREHHVTATFCVVGENARAHPDLIRAIVADGHTLCNHTWNHDVALGRRSPDRIRADLLRTSEAIHAAVPGVPIAYYRQPGGAWTHTVVTVAKDLGMTALHWTVDPSDWQTPGADRITATVVSGTRPGSIVLLHDAGGNRQGTVDALHRILPDLTSRFEVQALPNHLT